MKIKNKQKGFSLIELILVLGISSLAFIGFLKMDQKKAEITRAELAGEQIKEVGAALEEYLLRESASVAGTIGVGTTGTCPITVLQSAVGAGSCPNGQIILPPTYQNRNTFNSPYQIRIRNEGGTLIGLVTTAPMTDSGGVVRYDWLGSAMKKHGAKMAMSFNTAAQVTGLDGAWTLTAAQYNNITAAGQLAYRSQGVNAGNYDNIYLRRDGAFPMVGDLNMGNFNVNNVTDINVTGWVNSNNALINSLRTGAIQNLGNFNNAGNIINAGNITNTGRVDSTGRIISRDSTETLFINRYNDLGSRDVTIGDGGAVAANQGNIRVRDVYIRGGMGSGRTVNGGAGAWLSDLLPRYSSRGIFVANNGDVLAKPTCAAPGTPRLEVIPQVMWNQGRVMGTINEDSNGMMINADLYSVNAIAVYASDLGASWQVFFNTPSYNGAYVGGTGLVHIYCDMNF